MIVRKGRLDVRTGFLGPAATAIAIINSNSIGARNIRCTDAIGKRPVIIGVGGGLYVSSGNCRGRFATVLACTNGTCRNYTITNTVRVTPA